MQQASTQIPTAPSTPTISTAIGRRILANTGALAASSLWRIVISFVLQLFILRRLGVDGMGYYTIALTYLNVCQILSEVGLPTLFTRDLAQQPTQRRAGFRQALSLQVVMALLTWAGLILLTNLLPLEETSRRILWMVGASLPFYACTSVCQTIFQAGERMEYVFGIETLINTLILATSWFLLWRGDGVVALVTVLIATQALSALVGLLLVWHSGLLAAPQEPVRFDLRKLWSRAAPFYGLALADVLLQRLDTLLLSVVGGVTITGIYGASDNLVRVLLKLVQSLWRALYPTLSRLRLQTHNHYKILCQLSLRYGLIVLLPAATLGTVVAKDLLILVYDDKIASSIGVFQVAIWTAPAFLIELYAVTILMVENRPLRSMLITGVHLVVIAVLLPILTERQGALGAAIAVTVAGAAGTVVGMILLRQMQLSIELNKAGMIAIAALLAGLVAWFVPATWFIQLLIGGLAYLGLLWLSKALTVNDLRKVWGAVNPSPQPLPKIQRGELGTGKS